MSLKLAIIRPRVVPEVESTRLIKATCRGYDSKALTGMPSSHSYVEACDIANWMYILCFDTL